MKLGLTNNIPEFRALMKKRKRLLRPIIRKAVIDATGEVFIIDRNWMVSLIYVPPIPLIQRFRAKIRSGKRAGNWRKFRKPKWVAAWKRTSTLLRNERFYFRGGGDETTGTIDNATPYAKPRHDNDAPSPVDGIVRSAPWRTKAKQQGGPRARQIFREAIRAGGLTSS